MAYEPLEGRRLMAGNVSVNLSPLTNKLTLIGDGLSNQVQIEPAPGGGILISGQNGTTIAGLPQRIVGGTKLGDVSVDMGPGNDALRIIDIVFDSFYSQEFGSGRDVVVFDGVRATGDVYIFTAAGADMVDVDGLFAGDVFIDTGTQDDTVDVSGRIGVVLLPNGNLDDEYVFGGPTGGNRNLIVLTHNGNDQVSLNDLQHDGYANILTGGHADLVGTENVQVAGDLDIYTQEGDDQVHINNTTAARVWVWLGRGDDKMEIDPFSTFSSGGLRIDGGSGFDIVNQHGLSLGTFLNVEVLI